MIRSGEVEFHDSLGPLLVPLDSVQPHPENYNNGDVEAIKESILVNGMADICKVQRSTGYIVGGNHTWIACAELHAQHIPAVHFDLTDPQAYRLMIALNTTAAKARPDHGMLLELVETIKEEFSDISGTGLTDAEVERLQKLEEIPLEFGPYQHYVTLALDLPRDLIKVFRQITREADNDKDRFELLLRLAGWDGS